MRFYSWQARLVAEAGAVQSYIPTESFLSQYPAWNGWQANSYRKLPATRDVRQEGALLFLEGKITELTALEGRQGFEARVEDGRAYGSSVWMEGDGGSVAYECGCARPRKEALCRQSLAVFAAIDYLFFERNHLPLSPLSDHVAKLAAGIDRSGKKDGELLRRIRFCGLQEGAPYLEGDAAFDEGFIEAINPYGEMRRLARNNIELPRHNLRKTLQVLVDYVRDSKGIELEAERPEGGFLKLKPELASVGARLHFVANSAKEMIRMDEVADSLAAEDVLAYLDAKHLIFRDGRIAYIDENRSEPLQRAFKNLEFGFSDFSREGNEFSIEHYNICATRLDAVARKLLRQSSFSVVASGRKCSPVPADEDLPTETVILQLELRRLNEHGYLKYEASIDGYLGSYLVLVNTIFADFMDKLMHHLRDAHRFLGRRNRCEELLEATAQLPVLSTEAERRKFINKVSQRAIFEKPEHKRAVGKFMRQIEMDYCRAKSSLVRMCLPEDVSDLDSPYFWHPVEIPLPALLALTVRLYQHSSFYELLEMHPATIEIGRREQTLRELAEVCEHFGITMRIDEKTTERRPAVVEVLLSSSSEIDWFELKPSVRCDGFEIPQEDWERLMAGTLLLEGEDGCLVAPMVDRSDALAALVQLLDSSPRADRSTQVHRLHMLDWLTLRQSGVHLKIPEEIESLFHSLQHFKGIPEQPMPESIQAELRPYQKQGFEWLVFLHKHRFGACLADDMGLGKTLQTLCFLAYLKTQASPDRPLRALAVLPTSLLFNWEDEVARFLPSLSVSSYSGAERDPAVFEQTELVLTSYDLLWRDFDHFADRNFDLVIFDEAQAMKNHKSRRAQAARKLDRRFTLCLTGTPMENHPGEFHTIIDLALPGLMGPRKQFDEALRGGEDRLLRRARPFLLRRTKNAILKELPPKVESDIHLEMDEAQRVIYTRIVTELREEIATAYKEQTRAQAGISALSALTKLRQICVSPTLIGHKLDAPSPKIQHLIDSLLELREEGQSVLIFSQFVKVLDLVQTSLQQAGIRPLRLDGSTPAAKRRKAVEQFQGSEGAEIFLISLKAGGVGLNLTRASHVFHLDPWWNPAVENQASDRAHRIGQQATVFIQRLIMRDSIEEKIMTLKARKKELFHAIVEDPAAARRKGAAITKEDFEFLLGD